MKDALVAFALCAAAGPAGAQSAAPAPERPAADEPRLNLKLEDAAAPRPRIMFGPPPGTQGPQGSQGTGNAASSLPDLGSEPGKTSGFERRVGSPGGLTGGGTGGGPFPKDTNPNVP